MTPAPAPAIRLSLRWKAFLALLALLGLVHSFFGAYVYRQVLDQYRGDEDVRLTALQHTFDNLLKQSAQDLGRIGAQIAAATSTTARAPFDPSGLAPELLANLSGVWLFDREGHPLGEYRLPGTSTFPGTRQHADIAVASSSHRPVADLVCQPECTQFVMEPAFDRDGNEILVSLGETLPAVLQAFAQQSLSDIALLDGSGACAADSARLFGRCVIAITNAPALLPRLRGLASPGTVAPTGVSFQRASAAASFKLLLNPLSAASNSHIETLLILDDTDAQNHLYNTLKSGVAGSVLGLVLSALALWLLLTPLSSRLSVVTRALPLLAESQFGRVRQLLQVEPTHPLLFDEIDQLGATAQWLSWRLEELDSVEAASAAKTRFLATLSHEVRTPLNGILGMLEVLRYSELEPERQESLRMVHESAQALLRVMDDTLDQARIESGRIDLHPAPTSLEQLVAGLAESAAPLARRKSLKLAVFCDPALPALVSVDAMRLRQALGNLCSNAVKFTDAGRVVVRVRRLRATDTCVTARFTVEDSGIGISAASQQLLFQPFQQGESSTASRYGGSGLGLSIAQGLVQRMGGTIAIDSAPGRGSKFSFELELQVPAQQPKDERPILEGLNVAVSVAAGDERNWLCALLAASGAQIVDTAPIDIRDGADCGIDITGSGAAPQSLAYPIHRSALLRAVAAAAGRHCATAPANLPPTARRALRILAVDDHPTNRHVIRSQLSLLGHHTDVAADGWEALRMMGQTGYDLVLTDLRMAGMDGFELARVIRRQEDPGSRMPILALTAQIREGEAERCISAGMDGCLFKRLDLPALSKALEPWAGAPQPEKRQSVPAQHEAKAPIDRAALRRIIGDDDALAAELLTSFVGINLSLMTDLETSARSHNYVALGAIAHRLLGSARTAGAQILAHMIEEIESAADRKDERAVGALAGAAREEMKRVVAYVNGLSA